MHFGYFNVGPKCFKDPQNTNQEDDQPTSLAAIQLDQWIRELHLFKADTILRAGIFSIVKTFLWICILDEKLADKIHMDHTKT